MSHARELGFAIHERVAGSQEREQQVRETLHITPHELEKLYAGRLFLTGSDLRKVASVCGAEPRSQPGAVRRKCCSLYDGLSEAGKPGEDSGPD